MNSFRLNSLQAAALACVTSACLLLPGLASAAPGMMSKADHSAAADAIAATLKTDRAACKTMSGNAKDICVEEAKGKAKIAKADLEQSYMPSDKHAYQARLAKADAAFAIAKEKCDDQAGNAKAVCRKEAKAAHVSATADAKVVVKTADAQATAMAKTSDARSDAASDKRDAAYAVAVEKCGALTGDAKSACVSAAKAQYKP